MDKIRSLKNKTRILRRKTSYDVISEQQLWKKHNKSKEHKASKPKIMNDIMIPPIFFRNLRKEIPIVKIESEQRWKEYSVKYIYLEVNNM